MTDVQPGKIYLAEQRGLMHTDGLRRYSTFNFEGYYNEHKQAPGNLYAFNDEWLYGSRSVKTVIESHSYIVIIPVTGALVCSWGQCQETIDAGDIKIIHMAAQGVIEITNPYKGDWINYLQVFVKAGSEQPQSAAQLFSFDLSASPNHLMSVVNAQADELPFNISMGTFMGREEALYKPRDNAITFAFVLAGAFEAQGCLLHDRDGLVLYNPDTVDMEALSNNALIMLIDLPVTTGAYKNKRAANL